MSYYEYGLMYMNDENSKTMKDDLQKSWEKVKTNTKNLDNVTSLNLLKIQKSQENTQRSKHAISTALDSLVKVEYALPIHV